MLLCHQLIVIISIVIALFTAPLNFIIDYLFVDILRAPTEDAIAERKQSAVVAQAGRRVASAVRRASVTAVGAVATSPAVAAARRRNAINVVPEATLLAQSRARGAAAVLLLSSPIHAQQQVGLTVSSVPETNEETWQSLLAEIVAERDRISLNERLQFDATWGYVLQLIIVSCFCLFF